MAEAAAPVAPGDVLAGKYRVERVLGAGGMGVVVAATHLELRQRVALKFLLPHALASQEVVERFLREARAAAQLESEHVARVFDVGRLDGGAPYLVMELLDGHDLAAVASERPLPPGEAAMLVLQALEALAEAHAVGIVHRDLKPANLFLVRRRGRSLVKVLDFGISKVRPDVGDVTLTRTAAVMGTPAYMAPEQMRSARHTDARTDIWALGVILYQLVSGRLPFESDSFPDLVAQILQDPPAPLRVVPELTRVVERCLEKDPARRYPDVEELAAALAAFAPEQAAVSLPRIAAVLDKAPRSVAPTAPGAAAPVPPVRVAAPAAQRERVAPPPDRARLLLFGGAYGLAVMTTFVLRPHAWIIDFRDGYWGAAFERLARDKLAIEVPFWIGLLALFALALRGAARRAAPSAGAALVCLLPAVAGAVLAWQVPPPPVGDGAWLSDLTRWALSAHAQGHVVFVYGAAATAMLLLLYIGAHVAAGPGERRPIDFVAGGIALAGAAVLLLVEVASQRPAGATLLAVAAVAGTVLFVGARAGSAAMAGAAAALLLGSVARGIALVPLADFSPPMPADLTWGASLLEQAASRARGGLVLGLVGAGLVLVAALPAWHGTRRRTLFAPAAFVAACAGLAALVELRTVATSSLLRSLWSGGRDAGVEVPRDHTVKATPLSDDIAVFVSRHGDVLVGTIPGSSGPLSAAALADLRQAIERSHRAPLLFADGRLTAADLAGALRGMDGVTTTFRLVVETMATPHVDVAGLDVPAAQVQGHVILSLVRAGTVLEARERGRWVVVMPAERGVKAVEVPAGGRIVDVPLDGTLEARRAALASLAATPTSAMAPQTTFVLAPLPQATLAEMVVQLDRVSAAAGSRVDVCFDWVALSSLLP